MGTPPLHSWTLTAKEAVQVQKRLQQNVIATGRIPRPAYIAGTDAAFDNRRNRIHAAVVLLAFPSLSIVETAIHISRIPFPYIPGLLSFREAPALIQAIQKLTRRPDVIFTDGHGLAHPRSFGIGCHLGVLLDIPVIACAKSRLVGHYHEPGSTKGATSNLRDGHHQIIGAVVRTRSGVRPVFVSTGHKIGLKQAISLTLACAKGFRIPEPTRLADRLAAKSKRGETIT